MYKPQMAFEIVALGERHRASSASKRAGSFMHATDVALHVPFEGERRPAMRACERDGSLVRGRDVGVELAAGPAGRRAAGALERLLRSRERARRRAHWRFAARGGAGVSVDEVGDRDAGTRGWRHVHERCRFPVGLRSGGDGESDEDGRQRRCSS